MWLTPSSMWRNVESAELNRSNDTTSPSEPMPHPCLAPYIGGCASCLQTSVAVQWSPCLGMQRSHGWGGRSSRRAPRRSGVCQARCSSRLTTIRFHGHRRSTSTRSKALLWVCLSSDSAVSPTHACAKSALPSKLRSTADPEAGCVARSTSSNWLRIAELVSRYRDLPLGTVDASVVGAGERLELSQLATLDRRHFTVVRPAHIDAFELLPSQPDSG